jgi:hypothetical protein
MDPPPPRPLCLCSRSRVHFNSDLDKIVTDHPYREVFNLIRKRAYFAHIN